MRVQHLHGILCTPFVYPVAYPFVLQSLTVVNKRLRRLLTSSIQAEVSNSSVTLVLLQEQLTPRSGLKKASSEQQPVQQTPEHTPQQAPQQKPQQEKLGGTSFTARTTLTLDTALSLYNMTECQSFWETEQDTRCLIGWGSSTVVVAFRGTASMKNALADLQVRFSSCEFALCRPCDTTHMSARQQGGKLQACSSAVRLIMSSGWSLFGQHRHLLCCQHSQGS